MKRLVWFGYALLTLMLLMVLGALVLLAVPPFELDATGLEGRLTAALGEATGLQVSADGPLFLTLGSQLGIRGSNVRLRNPAQAGSWELLSARSLRFRVGAAPLLRGRLEPRALELEEAALLLHRGTDAPRLWRWASRLPAKNDSLELQARSARFVQHDAVSRPMPAPDDSANLAPLGATLEGQIDGEINGLPFRFQGTTMELSRLMETEEPIPLEFEGNLAGLDLSAKGWFAGPRYDAERGKGSDFEPGAAVDLAISVAGESLAGFAPWFGAEVANLGPVESTMALRGGPTALKVAPFEITLGEGRANGSLEIAPSATAPHAEQTFSLEIQGRKLPIAQLVALTHVRGMIRGDLNLGVELRAEIGPGHGIAGGLSGQVVALTEDVQAEFAGLEPIVGGASALLKQLLKPQAGLVQLSCSTVALDLRDGVTGVKAVVGTPGTLVMAAGKLDMVEETIDVQVDSIPYEAQLSAATHVVVSGPIAAPSYRIEQDGRELALGDLAAGVAIPQRRIEKALGDTAIGNDCVKVATGIVPERLIQRSSGATHSAADTVVGGADPEIETSVPAEGRGHRRLGR